MNTDQFPESDSLSMPNDDLRIEFDAASLYPDNPGNGQPVFVELEGYSASFDCALGEGELTNTRDETHKLTDRQYSWLQAQQDYVEQWLEYWTERKKGIQ